MLVVGIKSPRSRLRSKTNNNNKKKVSAGTDDAKEISINTAELNV